MACVTRRIAIVMATALGLLAAEPARADLALEFTSGIEAQVTGGDAAVGWSFTTTEAITVTTLDAYDPGAGEQVRLYDGSGTTLASATVLPTDPTVGSPFAFYSQAITPVTLSANTTYYIAEDTTPSVNLYLAVSGLTTESSITYDHGVYGIAGSNPLTDSPNGTMYYSPDYFGPNFNGNVSLTVSSPEPSTFLIAGLGGMAFLVYARRHRRVRA
jgi:PEP-CTERM motif